MNTETVAADTETLEPAPTEVVYAWRDEPDDDTEEVAEGRGSGVILGVAALAAVACVVAIATAVALLMRPTPQPERHYVIRPPIVEQLPPPKPAPPPPVIAAPPATPPVQQAPVQAAPPPDANQHFQASLGKGLMWQNTPDDDAQARQLCADLAAGRPIDGHVTGTERKSPQLMPQEARQVVQDAIEAYCPQYG
jgi:Protein of unknown function (DUF732)